MLASSHLASILKTKTTCLEISSDELIEKLKKRMDNDRFESVEAYITYVLEQVLD